MARKLHIPLISEFSTSYAEALCGITGELLFVDHYFPKETKTKWEVCSRCRDRLKIRRMQWMKERDQFNSMLRDLDKYEAML